MEREDWKKDSVGDIFGKRKLHWLEEEDDGGVAITWVRGVSDSWCGVTMSAKDRERRYAGVHVMLASGWARPMAWSGEGKRDGPPTRWKGVGLRSRKGRARVREGVGRLDGWAKTRKERRNPFSFSFQNFQSNFK
jgi:hypothetical protein